MGGARKPRRLYVPPTPHTEYGGLLKGTDRAVTTCQLPLQTVDIVDIQQHLTNLDTMALFGSARNLACTLPGKRISHA